MPGDIVLLKFVGIYVNRIVKCPMPQKRIEKLTLAKAAGSTANEDKGVSLRDRIVRRAAKEFKDGREVE